ncbi:MAG: polyhydroxyalkanoate synthesis repressor PhaR [Caulobacterales bacterium]
MQSNETTSGTAKSQEPIIIKKYANRRLYNTGTSAYVTLDHLSDLVKQETAFIVQDAKTGEDITRQILTQIIFEHENKGESVLPAEFLRQIIRFYGDNLQAYLPSYLNMSIDTFTRSRERMREAMTKAMGITPGVPSAIGLFEEQLRQNMTMFENAAKMFTPFVPVPGRPEAPKTAEPAKDEGDISELKKQLDSMQKKLDALSGNKP